MKEQDKSPWGIAGRPDERGSRGFTLVELLVVISIVALLISLLLPSLRAARDQSKRVKCMAGLHGIGMGVLMYADANRQEMPSYETIGKHGFRVAPGLTLRIPIPGGTSLPSPYPEAWGLQAVLHIGSAPRILPNGVAISDIRRKPMYISGDSKVWICPGNPGPLDRRDFKEWKNTYSYRCNSQGSYNVDRLSSGRGIWNSPIVWDNYQTYPGDPGFNGPFDNYTIDSAFRRAPHRSSGRDGGPSQFWVAFYLDGHAQMNGMNH